MPFSSKQNFAPLPFGFCNGVNSVYPSCGFALKLSDNSSCQTEFAAEFVIVLNSWEKSWLGVKCLVSNWVSTSCQLRTGTSGRRAA